MEYSIIILRKELKKVEDKILFENSEPQLTELKNMAKSLRTSILKLEHN